MKAAILEKLNTPLVVDELHIPNLKLGQVLVRVMRSGICGAQINEITGVRGEDKYLPHLLGHEGGGVVEGIGPGVTQIQKADHVVMHWRKGTGIESPTPLYRRNGGFVGGGWVTTFNEYAVVSENRLTPVPGDIPFEIAALMGCAVTTGLGIINNEAQLKIGQSIAVFGCGGVGLNVIQGASMVSAYPIIGIDIYQRKLKMAERFGATHLIDANLDIRDEIKSIVGSRGVDVAVETTGNLIPLAYGITSPKGRTIMVGQPRHTEGFVIPKMLDNFGGKILFASQGGETNPKEDIPRYALLYLNGKLKFDGLITHRYPLEKVNEAIADMQAGKTGRCMLEME